MMRSGVRKSGDADRPLVVGLSIERDDMLARSFRVILSARQLLAPVEQSIRVE